MSFCLKRVKLFWMFRWIRITFSCFTQWIHYKEQWKWVQISGASCSFKNKLGEFFHCKVIIDCKKKIMIIKLKIEDLSLYSAEVKNHSTNNNLDKSYQLWWFILSSQTLFLHDCLHFFCINASCVGWTQYPCVAQILQLSSESLHDDEISDLAPVFNLKLDKNKMNLGVLVFFPREYNFLPWKTTEGKARLKISCQQNFSIFGAL